MLKPLFTYLLVITFQLMSSSHHIRAMNHLRMNTDLSKFQIYQYQCLEQQLGKWIGIQTGYAVDDVAVEDYMYCEEELVLNTDGDNRNSEIVHSRSLVLGEIRADCEVCYDSERLKTKEIGRYSVGKMRTRHCENVELRGPALTPRGLSIEGKR